MASAVAGLIAGKLAGLIVNEANLLWSFKDDVDDLKETLERLKAWMHDADKRLSQDEGQSRETVWVWMKKFKSVAYDADDLLDEFEAIELIKQSQTKIKLFFSSYNPLLVRLTMAHRMKKLKEALNNIEEKGLSLNLMPHDTQMWAEGSTNQATIASTNGDIGIGMVGRDIEKENIMKLLLESEAEEDISIIPIVGLGGLGKTTLAQAVFSDKRAKIFDLRVWVYVSKKFDLSRIGKIIISTVSANIESGTNEKYIPPNNGDLQTVLEQMKNILPTKRYLIVLDDIWEEGVDNLEKMKQMLQYGGKGSKIILTTRMQRVVDILDAGVLANQRKICPVRKSDQINLNLLSDEDCWNVMRQTALGRDDNLGQLEDIGRQIAKKCGGLPLLARSLGFLLSQNKSTDAWEDIRDRKIILGMTEDHQPPETLERLMLSYYYMPFKVKLCFTYCAVFPKGFAVARDHLIQQWRALGYIQSVDAHHCINYLLGMSFLQISKSSQSAPEQARAPDKFTMHDLVHDLARIIADNELIVLDASEQMTPRSRAEKHYYRHMQLVNYQKQPKPLKEFPGKIRSLHFIESQILQLQQKSFSKSKYLRVLDISGCSIEAKNILLPSSIHQLTLLRYLDASGLPMASLPKYLHKLQNMQTLILSNCTLETVPDNIGSLVRLCYLDISGNSSLTKLPISLGKLCELSYLNLSGCSKLEELPEPIHELECLRHLDMSGCCALQKLPDKFGSLPKLLFLNLSSCSKLVKLPDNLKSLEHLNLSSCHELQNLPSDFGNLHKLEFLNLSDCYKVRVLPESFCQLQHLKDLDLSDCHDLKEFPGCFGNLSELHSLNLTSCSKLQSLPESFCDLSKLKHLNLSYCVNFRRLPPSFSKLKLQVLDLRGCRYLSDLPDIIGSMNSLTRLLMLYRRKADLIMVMARLGLSARRTHEVRETGNGECCSILDLGKLTCEDLQVTHLENVKHPEDAERAKLRDNPELRGLALHWTHEGSTLEKKTDAEKDQLVLENLIPPRSLEEFALDGYMSKEFPNWMLDISSYLPYLLSIRLSSLTTCDSLPPFGRLPNLRTLRMDNIPNVRKIGMEFYGEEGVCKRLRIIDLSNLVNLDEWWTTRSGHEDEEFLIPNLHLLMVTECPKLKFLPCPPRSMYWELHNSDEVLPEHGFGWLSSSTIGAHITSRYFSSDKWTRLQHLATLESLCVISNKKSLTTLPDTPCPPSLRNLTLSLKDLETLPEWLGRLVSLESLEIDCCPNLTSLPESTRNLTSLKKLEINGCPRLAERCQGEDAHKISHIPEVISDGRRIVPGQAIEGSEEELSESLSELLSAVSESN